MSETSPIIGRRHIEITNHERVKIGDVLPIEYGNILNEVKTLSKSETFTKQAEQVVYYFFALDKKLPLYDQQENLVDTEKFAELLASMPWVSLQYVRFSRSSITTSSGGDAIQSRRSVTLGSPETSLPQWLQAAYASRPDRVTTAPILVQFYETYKNSHAMTEEQRRHGTYASYPAEWSPDVSDKVDAQFKGYLEIDAEVMHLEKAFQELAQQKLHPHESKMFEGRLVLYWSCELTAELIEKIQNIFSSNTVAFRGPGEDSVFLARESDGLVHDKIRVSNDQALGEGGHARDFTQETFDPVKFIKTYLEQCYRFWRNPANPYQLSFVPAFDRTGRNVQDMLDQKERVIKELVPMEGWVPQLFVESNN